MDDDHSDWNLDKVKLEHEVILDDDVEANENFTVPYREQSDNVESETSIEQTSASSERIELNLMYGLSSVPDPGSSARGDAIVKIKEELIDDVTLSVEPLMGNRQNSTRETAASQESFRSPVESIYIKEEVVNVEESDTSKNNQPQDFMEAEGIHHGKEIITSCSPIKKMRLAIAQKIGIKSEKFDSLTDKSTLLRSEHFPEPSSSKLGSENSSVTNSGCIPSVSTDSVKSDAKKGVPQDQMDPLKLFLSTQCLATSLTSAYSNPLNPTLITEKRFFCQLCPASYNRLANYRTHMKTKHSKGKTLDKTVSSFQHPTQFKSKTSAQRYLLAHSSEKAFFCDKCCTKIEVKCNLQDHLAPNFDKKKFSCSFCSTPFKQKCKLKMFCLDEQGLYAGKQGKSRGSEVTMTKQVKHR